MSKREGRDKMSNGNISLPGDYEDLLLEVKVRVRAAQYEALRVVNKELVGLYWDIGRMICERSFPGLGGFQQRIYGG